MQQAEWTCHYCGRDVRGMSGDEMDMHVTGWCVRNEVLAARAKHGAGPVSRQEIVQRAERARVWLDSYYRELMLLLMVIELLLLVRIAWKA